MLDLELHSVSPRLDSRQLAFLNSSQLDHILLRPKEESTLHLEICTMMTGDGIFMTQLKDLIGSVTKMQFNT